MRTQDSADERGVDGCGSAFAADVPDGDADESAAAVGNEVVEIAADCSRGDELGGELGVLQRGTGLRKEAVLEFAGEGQVLLESAFLLGDALVESCVLDG